MSNISEEEKLAWGDFDFIEESASFSSTPLNFEEISEVSISEAKSSEKSPFKLIGRVCGCIAPIDCMSRNGRLYEASHWPKILSNPELQERIANRKFFGMISHENCPINDRNFKAGEISHICKLLEVRNDDNGKPYLYGELDILDTPAGRILKAMYEGGAGLYVSTRAAGRLLESTRGGKPVRIVDSDKYYINSIDFVLNPGFLQAKPAFEAVSSEPVQPQIHESDSNNSIPPVNKPFEVQNNNKQDQPKKNTNKKGNNSDFEEVLNAVIKNQEEQNSTSNESLQSLQSQVEKLTKIIEKVVDDVYEEPSQQEPVEEAAKEKKKEKPEEKVLEKKPEEAPQMQEQPIAPNNEALIDFISLMASTNISEEAFESILDTIAQAKKEAK